MMERSGDDLRSLPLEERKAGLRSLLVRSKMGIVYSDHVAGDEQPLAEQTRVMAPR